MPHDPRTPSYGGVLPRHVSPERARQLDDELRARLAGVPKGHVPYATWSRQVGDLCRARSIRLAQPKNFTKRLQRPHPLALPAGGRETVTVEHLLQYQEQFYRDRYRDPTFAFDRSKLHLPQERVTDILDALTRGDVNYPLVVATPRTLTEAEAPHTLLRILMDRLIRAMNIRVRSHDFPDVDTMLEQLRGLTFADLTLGPEGWRARGHDGVDYDGAPLAFTEDGWLPYLQALYPTLPRPTVQPGYLDLSFVAWKWDPLHSYVVPNVHGPRGGKVRILLPSQFDVMRYRYPLITPSRCLTLFAQYLAATKKRHFGADEPSWIFGIADPDSSYFGPFMAMCWRKLEGLDLDKSDLRGSYVGGFLRCAR